MWVKWFLDVVLGRLQTALWIAGLFGISVSGIVAALSTAPLYALVLIFLSASLVFIGCAIGWQNYRSQRVKNTDAIDDLKIGEIATQTSTSQEVTGGSPNPNRDLKQEALLTIKHTDEAANRRYMRFEDDGGPCTWYLEIVNESIDADAQDVEIKVESCDQIPDLLSPHTHTAAFTKIGKPLTFERGGQTRTIRRQDSEWVKFLSFDRKFPRRWIQIGEYGEGRLDLHGKIVSIYTPHRIEVTVRAANANPVTAHYVVKAENEMLQVQKL